MGLSTNFSRAENNGTEFFSKVFAYVCDNYPEIFGENHPEATNIIKKVCTGDMIDSISN